MPRPRARTAAGLVAALGLLLTGCAAIPTSGPVVEGGPAGIERPPPYVARIPDGPVPGASEEEVVVGFVEAMGSYQPGYTTAALYLSPGARPRWSPQAGTTVYDADAGVATTRVAPGRVQLALTRVGRIDADGSYRGSRPAREVLTLRLGRDGGEWRIEDPPAGVLMSTFDTERELAAYDVYFAAPVGQSLVASRVYLPVRSAVPTLLVSALLRGAPRDLAPAVTSGFPPGATLSGPGVPVDGGVAEVALAVGAAQVSPAQRDLMSTQLVWTLGQAGAVTGVRLTLDGVPVETAGSPPSDVQPLASWQQYDPLSDQQQALTAVVDGAAVEAVAGAPPQPVAGVLGTRNPPVRSAARARGSAELAAVTADGRALVATLSPEVPTRRLLTGEDLGQPSWDRYNRLWVVERGPTRPGVRVVDPRTGTVVGVPVRFTGGAALSGVVDRVALARDGVRVALLVRGGGGTLRLLVGAVVGGRDDQPLEVRVLDELAAVPGVVDADWNGPSELAVIGVDDGSRVVQLVSVDGARTDSRGQVEDAVAVAAVPGQSVTVSTRTGRLLRLDASQQWVQVGRGRLPTYGG